jgi:hypothetical protein
VFISRFEIWFNYRNGLVGCGDVAAERELIQNVASTDTVQTKNEEPKSLLCYRLTANM